MAIKVNFFREFPFTRRYLIAVIVETSGIERARSVSVGQAIATPSHSQKNGATWNPSNGL